LLSQQRATLHCCGISQLLLQARPETVCCKCWLQTLQQRMGLRQAAAMEHGWGSVVQHLHS
jgi:hypothetical protein